MDGLIAPRGRGIVVLGALAALLLALAAADSGAAARQCGSFPNQAAAQDHFLANGGAPGQLRGLDPDGDGVACEELGAPYKGYATLGYNKGKRFFYGTVTMPAGGGAEAHCLVGNRHYPDGPRKLNVYRVRPGEDTPVLPDFPGTAAEARRDIGKLFWKANKGTVRPGLYYVEFEDKIRPGPYEATECPGFASAPRQLPKPEHVPQRR